MPTPTLGDLEQAALDAVKRLAPCTVRAVFEDVGVPRALAYTTLATVLDRLHHKGLVARTLEGKALVYRTTRKYESAAQARARALVGRVLGSEPLPAVARLVDAVEAIDPKLLDRLADEVASRRRRRRGS